MREAREWDKGGTRVVRGCGDAVSMSLRWVGGLVYGVGGVGCIGSDEGEIRESAGCVKCEGGTRVGQGWYKGVGMPFQQVCGAITMDLVLGGG